MGEPKVAAYVPAPFKSRLDEPFGDLPFEEISSVIRGNGAWEV